MELTEGSLLGGRVRYAQPVLGYRTGIEPVLLAASVQARPGQRVLEAGLGAGAGLLCLAARVAGLACTGIERDPVMAELARANATANAAPLGIVTADVTCVGGLSNFDHAIANPPWHGNGSTASPDLGRDGAKRGRAGLVHDWAAVLAAALQPGGGLTLILPASAVAEGLAALSAASCGERTFAPLWPKSGRPAKIVLIRGIRGSRAADRVMPGLVLHQASGAYTPAAEAILRGGSAWLFDQPTSSG